MTPLRPLLSILFFGVPPLLAQTTVTVPNLPSFVSVAQPFSSGICRYQQWYSAASLQAAIAEPMRFERVEFFAGGTPTSQAATLTCAVLLGYGKPSGVMSAFDSNWDAPPQVVFPQGAVQLTPGPAGSVVISIPFAPVFTWDRSRPLLIEVRIFGNSLGNQPFNFNFAGTTTSVGTTSRVHGVGSASAVTGSVAQGVGLISRFTVRPGAVVPFGTGCAGAGGFVPVNEVLQVPSPGIPWSHRVSNANSQVLAIWVIGDTRDAPFPIDLLPLFGLPPSTCNLLTNPANTVGAMTIGGGPGGGIATLTIGLPGVASYVGLSLFTQWVVLDPAAPTGLLSVTQGMWSIVAPVGG